MKALEQLGISPAPWKVAMDDIAMVFSGSQYPSLSTPHICEVDIIDDPERKCNDIKLIAAAPNLYDALYRITKEQQCGQDCMKCKNHGCVIKECKAALAKAAGESEVER